ncbi:MAG TPA: ABC transporter ATP-binding protein [Bryobacteraceae bacterium]|jgi:molybdate transport system ATP-binding protein|nr:ABC transporter ATP-binding protein [Bryobacteraceae bacterium]
MIQARIRKQYAPGQESAAFSLDVDLKAEAGITVLFGPSGAGKTLTLDCIAGFVRPDEGRILLDDEILFDGASGVHLPARARRCGYVFQNYALFPHMTLRQNLEFAVERVPRLERHRKVNEMLEKFHLAEVSGRRPYELSGGQKQRCSIARALIGSPRLLLLDEPARGLDAPLRAELYAALRQVRQEFQIPTLLVTHDFEECIELGDEMLVLRDGRVVQSGTPRKVLEYPANVDVARLLGVYNLLPVEIRGLDPGRNVSRLRYQDFELTGPYFPGRLIGDRVWLCIRPDVLTVAPKDGRLGGNQMPATLVRAVDKLERVRLEFADDIAVELPRPAFEKYQSVKNWVIEFPSSGLRIL